jgi:hypothetical protein
MAATAKFGALRLEMESGMPPYFSIPDLASRWRCSRGTVYNVIRGEKVLDFAAPGRKGKKLVPRDVVCRIEQSNTRVWR